MDQLAGAGGSGDALSWRAGGRRRRHAPSTMAGAAVPDRGDGQRCRVSAEALRAHLLDHVPKWWLPDAIAFAKELPHGPTGKLQKDILRRHVVDGTIVPTGC